MRSHSLDKLVIGFLLGVCLMLVIGAARSGSPSPVGTYQVGCDADDVYVLNTQTGQLWNATRPIDWVDCGRAPPAN